MHLLAMIVLLAFPCMGMDWNFERFQEVNDEPADDADWQALHKAAGEYIRKNKADEVAFLRHLKGRVETRVNDSGCSEEIAVREISIEWMSDNQKALEEKQPKAIITACMHLRVMMDRGIDFPWQIVRYASKPVVHKLIGFLKGN